jgi:hypothetical protein
MSLMSRTARGVASSGCATPRRGDHATFAIERTYEAAPARVWRAWADPEEKLRWFGPSVLAKPEHELDFRVGGLERMTVQAPDGARAGPGSPPLRSSCPTRSTWRVFVRQPNA